MNRSILFSLLLLVLSVRVYSRVYTNGAVALEEYTLSNGLTVFLMENHGEVDVCGTVVVRAGEVDEPDGHRGVANFLGHALMCGTRKIGALDWLQEKPIYEEIIALYDSLSMTVDEQKYSDLWQRITEKTEEAARYSSSNEFANLLAMMGAMGIKNSVYEDYTQFRSNFPPQAMAEWLQLNSERFIDPVFRNFQSRLNLFYEEFNRYSTPYNLKRQFLSNQFYKGTPYARPEKGTPEELLHPSMSAMIDFYNTWYVAGNMALVLVGNFDSEAVKPLIEETFGRLPNRPLPERKVYQVADFHEKNRNKVNTGDFGWFLGFGWYFTGPDVDSDEFVHMKFVEYMLSNSNRSGLINQLEYSGLFENTNESRLNTVSTTLRRDVKGSVIAVSVVPWERSTEYSVFYDTKFMVFDKINMLKHEKKIPEQLFMLSKNYLLDEVERFIGAANIEKAEAVCRNWVMDIPQAELFDTEKIDRVTKADIANFVQKYLSDNYLTVIYDILHPVKKIAELQLGQIDKPVTPVPRFNDASVSEYAQYLLPDGAILPDMETPAFNNMEERVVAEEAMLYYTPDAEGENFTLTLRYEYGLQDDRDLGDLTYALNRTGIKPGIPENARRRMFEELGATIKMHADYNYFYIDLIGNESNLERILNVTTVWMLAPWLDRRQLYDLWQCQYGKRIDYEYVPYMNDALRQYVFHGNMSDYLNLSPKEDLIFMSITETGKKYFDYMTDRKPLDEVTKKIMCSPVDMFYRGNMPVDTVAKLMALAPMAELDRIPVPRREKPLVYYGQTGVHYSTHLPSSVSYVTFYSKLTSFRYDDYIPARVFSIYFQSLLDDELRQKRAMALEPTGRVAVPLQPNGECGFIGDMEVGGENTTQAIDLYMSMLNDMPLDDNRFHRAIRACYQECINSFYGPDKGRMYNWLQNVYPAGVPVEEWLSELKTMTIHNMQWFYESRIKPLPVQIIVTADKDDFDTSEMRKYGAVRPRGPNRLFKDTKEFRYSKIAPRTLFDEPICK